MNFQLLNIRMIPDEVALFFRKIIDETVRLREKNKTVRPDLIHLMMLSRKGKLKYEEFVSKDGFAVVEESDVGKTGNSPNYLSNEDITAQVLVFFLGAYDTVSSLIAFVAYELAINPTIQKRLRQEIRKFGKRSDDDITYENLLEIKYLDMVITEMLRKWPPAIRLDRKCTKAFKIEPERSGEALVQLKEGDICWIPVYGIHMDPRYYPNPEVFDPERFSEDNVDNVKSATYLPFGIGPRNCIGSRFALLETKIVLYKLLLEFEFVATEKTQIPIKIKKNTAALLPEQGFHIGFKRNPLF